MLGGMGGRPYTPVEKVGLERVNGGLLAGADGRLTVVGGLAVVAAGVAGAGVDDDDDDDVAGLVNDACKLRCACHSCCW